MPSVPKVTGQSIQQAGFGNARAVVDAPEAAFNIGQGAALEKSIGGVGSAIQEYSAKAINAENEFAFKSAVTQRDQIENEMTAGENGYQKVKGKDALGLSEKYGQELAKKTKEIEDSLPNNWVKSYFKQYSQKADSEFKKQTDTYSNHEYGRFQNEENKNGMETQRTRAILNFNDSKLVEESIARQNDLANDFAKRNGIDPAPLIAENESKTRAGIIQQMILGGNPIVAEKYFEAHKDSFTSDDALRLESVLKTATRQQKANYLADQIYNKEGYTSIPAAYERAKSIGDEDLKDAVMSEIKVRAALDDQRQKENHSKVMQDTLAQLESGNTLNDLPAQAVGMFTPKEKSAFKIIQEIQSGARDIKPDAEVYHDLSTKSPYELSRMTMGELIVQARPHVTNEQWNSLKQKWTNAQWVKDGDESKKNAWVGEQSADETIFRLMRTSKLAGLDELDEKASKTEQKELFVKFKDKYNDAALLWSKQNNGKKPDADTMQKIAKGIVFDHAKKVQLKGTFFGYNEKNLGDLSPEEKQKVVVPFEKIPENDFKKMVNILYINGQLKGMTQDQAIGIIKNKDSSKGSAFRSRIEKAYGQMSVGNYENYKNKLLGK